MKSGKENLRIEKIFSHAVALQQSGRLRSTIYCLRKFIYILNQDHTILIRFISRDAPSLFSSPVSFNANDYDAGDFEEREGKIHFRKNVGDWIKEKSCRTPQFSPMNIHQLFKKYLTKLSKTNRVVFDESFQTCLDSNLSHIEFGSKDGNIMVKQRNIYAGSVTTIQPIEKHQLMGTQAAKLKPFKPVGIRTNDFSALFQFVSAVIFYFSSKKVLWFESTDKKLPFIGLIGHCLYDEIGIE